MAELRDPKRTTVCEHDGVDHKAMVGEPQADFFQVCIDEDAGCGLPHERDWGYDFPMSRNELITLRDQIDAVLKQ